MTLKTSYLNNLKSLSFAISMSAASLSLADKATDTPAHTGQWTFEGMINHVSLDEAAAAKGGVEDSAFSLGILANYEQSMWMTTLQGEIVFYDDRESFDEAVRSNFDDYSVETSSASALLVGGAFGPIKYFKNSDDSLNQAAIYGQLGFNAVLSSERSIDNCRNCTEEDIDINGGAFFRAGAKYNFSPVSLGLSYSVYLSGDLDSITSFTIGSTF